jgi:DNA-directed RNA polymerase specialized sigma24 family protein
MQPIELDEEAIELLELTASRALDLLESLATEQREAIEGHYLEEPGYPELARDLSCSESVVRKRASRGLALLRSQFREEEAS